jgi:hypothetical protein
MRSAQGPGTRAKGGIGWGATPVSLFPSPSTLNPHPHPFALLQTSDAFSTLSWNHHHDTARFPLNFRPFPISRLVWRAMISDLVIGLSHLSPSILMINFQAIRQPGTGTGTGTSTSLGADTCWTAVGASI